LCVAGTDTGVGKTVVSALLARAALQRGPAAYWKPVQTGSESDTDAVVALCGPRLAACEPRYRFALPASPHTAAAAQGEHVDFDALRGTWRGLRDELGGTLVVELAGGLLVPYDGEHTQADLVARERPGIVLVARSGLGTLNHVLLTLEALGARGLKVQALFLVGERHAANAATLRERTGAWVLELERLEPLDTGALDTWLDENDLARLFA
jgi:malonyl-CoA O-methyltransferase